jgi:hypothetical protein
MISQTSSVTDYYRSNPDDRPEEDDGMEPEKEDRDITGRKVVPDNFENFDLHSMAASI